ncbi:MAG: FtsQ-type POTRA domain-containing protein [Candidatus Omnitrophica bacterium]|nr:FtsQ-type POTRA domain-containing protein [Candidatus Omnitrophota bacterium]
MAGLKKKKDKKNFKGIQFPGKKIWIFLIRKSALPLVVIAILILAFIGVRAIFLTNPMFKISAIRVDGMTDGSKLKDLALVRSCMDKNIFSLNIKEISSGIKKVSPELKKVVVRRVMPDTIEIYALPRIPVAVIKGYKYFPIDENGVVISSQSEPDATMPVINGISGWHRPKVGEVFHPDGIDIALMLLKNLKETNALGSFALKGFDISNIRNIRLLLRDGPEIRLGKGQYREKLEKLSVVLADPKIDIDNLKYIDLRFNEAVLGPK